MKIFGIIFFAAVMSAGCSGFKTNSGGADSSLSVPMCPSTNAAGLCAKCGTQVTLTWVAPTTNTNGTPITNLSGFNIYYGTSVGNYATQINVANPATTSQVVDNLAPDIYYFVATAYETQNGVTAESAYSADVGIKLEACSHAKVNTTSHKVVYEYLPPKIIDTNVEPLMN